MFKYRVDAKLCPEFSARWHCKCMTNFCVKSIINLKIVLVFFLKFCIRICWFFENMYKFCRKNYFAVLYGWIRWCAEKPIIGNQSSGRRMYLKKKPNIFSICMSVPYSTKTRLVPYSANIFFFLDSGILNFDYRFFLCLPLFTIYKENIFTRFGYQFKKKIVYWPCVSNQPIGYRDIVVVDLKNIILKKPP